PMTTAFVLVLLLVLAAAGYVPAMRSLRLRQRYSPSERRFIRASDARLERDPGDLAAALALADLYRSRGDARRLAGLYQHTRMHLEGRPEFEPLKRAALVAPWVGAPVHAPVDGGGAQSFRVDMRQATGRLRLAGVLLQNFAEIVQLE